MRYGQFGCSVKTSFSGGAESQTLPLFEKGFLTMSEQQNLQVIINKFNLVLMKGLPCSGGLSPFY